MRNIVLSQDFQPWSPTGEEPSKGREQHPFPCTRQSQACFPPCRCSCPATWNLLVPCDHLHGHLDEQGKGRQVRPAKAGISFQAHSWENTDRKGLSNPPFHTMHPGEGLDISS